MYVVSYRGIRMPSSNILAPKRRTPVTAAQVPSSKSKAKNSRVTEHTVSKDDKSGNQQGAPVIPAEQIITTVQEVANRVQSTLTGNNDTASVPLDLTIPADNATGALTREITGGSFSTSCSRHANQAHSLNLPALHVGPRST